MSTQARDLTSLLTVCLEDLYAGRVLAAEALPSIAAAVGLPVSQLVDALAGSWRDQARAINALEPIDDPAENLWMGGIVKDAHRDTETIPQGSLRDIAIVGAVRKAVAADAVSLETAIAIANTLSHERAQEALSAMRTHAHATDEQFRTLLLDVTRAAG
ncbi:MULTISPECIES: DUF892 family protein [unclassified Sphingobium]|uniref:DUF892 family protein n=1 Tax=unclassified Sphingobium TaxID=2611147 RepID=UPI002224DF0B|nr:MULTISPECIES: DUF892 family protein [unclassified Sphingobium]MCW2381809.1 ferritin-like metal-binding protein YciE [Sphingobium sp. B2D3B]MCW2398085.1 ferritin-like metal-binding protein YciE [Sphingobium sp. B2D3C]